MVSQPVLGPEGPLIRVARLEVSDDLLSSIPDLVANRLEEAGVADAVVRAPSPAARLDRLDSCPNAVVLRLFPPPDGRGRLAPGQLDRHRRRVGARRPGAHDAVPLRLLAVEFDVKVADAPAVLHQASTAQAWCDVVNGDARRAGAHRVDHLRQGAPRRPRRRRTRLRQPGAARPVRPPVRGGPRVRRRRGLRVPRHRDHLRRHRARAAQHGLAGPGRRVAEPGGRAALRRPRPRRLPVPDPRRAATWPGSGTRPTTRTTRRSARPSREGKVELFIGEPVDWLPIYDARGDGARAGLGAARAAARRRPASGRAARRAPRPVGGPEPSGDGRRRRRPPPGAVMPALDDITLETLPHGRRGLRLTLLELAAWLAHEPHSDAPDERVAGARHLRPLVRVGARRPPPPDPQGPRPPPHRHRPAGARPAQLGPAAAVSRRLRPGVAGDRLADPRAGRVVAAARRPHRGGRSPRVDRAHQQPPRPGARRRRARLRDHDRRPPDRPHRLHRRLRARRRQRRSSSRRRGTRGSGRRRRAAGSPRRRRRRSACPPSSPTPPTSA